MMVVDVVKSFGMDGRAAEETLDRIGITTNKQVIPDDTRPPLRPSGIRLGTPACTTRGMDESDMTSLAEWMVAALKAPSDNVALDRIRRDLKELCARYPVPGLN